MFCSVAALTTQLRRKLDQSPVVDDEFPIRAVGRNAPPGGNVYSVTQPDTSNSYKITATRARASPYGSETANLGAVSMSELSQPNPPNLKQFASNPNLGTNRFNSSTTDLVPPVPVRNPSRPATPVKQQPPPPPQNWMNPLEMHSTKGPSQFTVTMVNAPKSPLDSLELKLEIPSEPPAPYPNEDEVPMPLRIRRPSPAPQPAVPPQRSQSPEKPPSPPQSIRGTENQSPVLGRPSFSRDDIRPSSRGSHRNMPTTLKEVQNMRDVRNKPNYGPASIPSPISTPRGSEEKATNNIMDLLGEPVIRQVGARRDTLTSTAPRRMSLEMKVEQLVRPRMDDMAQRPKTSNGPGPGPQTRQLMRPPPLNLDHRPRTPDRAGTYPPAPFMMDQRPHTPTGGGSRGPIRDRNGPPLAAVGAHGRPSRPNTKNVRRPAVDEYAIQPQSQPQSRRVSLDSSGYDRPPSPDSPLLPQTGPLASPRFPPIDSQLAPPPLQGGARSHLQQVETFLLEDEPDEQLAAPRLGHRNVPTPDPSDWPLPSPTTDSFEPYRPESPFIYGGIRAESPFSRVESPLPTPPRVLPQGVAARSDSPFGFRSFNFSRPMTPTLEQPPLRRDISGTGMHSPFVPKRSETVPVSPKFRDAESSPSPGRAPPPRANTVNTNVGRGLRSPAIVGDDFGGGFI
ncbi:hypothetical protein F5Y13DRAFT_172953 [Hypoxylon sp. FL1857]|nr:hypothetical protein F5Y13DRAFT_172953 [Hypoxylon sp. FL1857]